ncbi:MAG: hypothetical protein Q8L54_00870, partial [Devosia sp.]|nr:hypothetical protein [Devosia sp.]
HRGEGSGSRRAAIPWAAGKRPLRAPAGTFKLSGLRYWKTPAAKFAEKFDVKIADYVERATNQRPAWQN